MVVIRTIDLDSLSHRDGNPEKLAEKREDEVRLLEAMLKLFPLYPDHMAAAYLKYFSGKKAAELAVLLNTSQRSIHRLINGALRLLKSKVVFEDKAEQK